MAVTTAAGAAMNRGNFNKRVGLGDKLDAVNDCLAVNRTALATYLSALQGALNTQCFNSAGLAEGTNANTFQIANAITYTIAGVRYVKGATNNIAFTAAAEQATDTNCIYLVCIDAAGTVSTVKGTAVAAASAATCPSAGSASLCAIGWIHVATANAATFTAGSTDLGASDVTDTYVNFVGSTVGSAPLVAAAQAVLTAAQLAAQPADV